MTYHCNPGHFVVKVGYLLLRQATSIRVQRECIIEFVVEVHDLSAWGRATSGEGLCTDLRA